MHICSLLPSATEIVAALGLADSLVAVSEECDWPPEVRELPVVTASRVDTTRLSGVEIDRAVREAVRDGRPLYAIDRELLAALEPDLILTQNLCTVCAVSGDTVEELDVTDADIVPVDAHSIAEIEERILSLASLLGVAGRGRAVVDEMEAKMAAVTVRVADAPRRPVFVAEWLDPPFAAGHWIPEMVALAGGRDVLGRAGAPSYPTSWETVRRHRPELLVVAPCGFDHTRAAAEATLPALGCRAVAVDSNAYYARPAPRVADGVAQLAFLVHPELAADPGLPYVELAAQRDCADTRVVAEVRVRQATEGDARAVAAVHVESWREGYAHVFPADRLAALSVDQRETLARHVLAHRERETLLVAEVDGAVAGFASAGVAHDRGIESGEVYAIYVAPDHWGQGVGRALMQRALQLLVERGFEQAVLWVLDDNPRARRFYEAGGWRLDGARRRGEHLGVETAEVRYRIDLPR